MGVPTPAERHKRRLAELRRRMEREDIDLVLVAHASGLRYLVGFSGSNGLLAVGLRQADFLTDARYTLQARSEVKGAKVTVVVGDLTDHLPKLPAFQKGRKKIGYETHRMTDARAQKLRGILPRCLFVGFSDLLAPIQQVKDQSEIALIEKAAAVADTGFASVLEHIRPGVREKDVAAELEYAMLKAGSEGIAFDTIVASGPRGALPHGRASVKRIKTGDFVTLDFGATVGGYASDMTRTVVVGKPSARQKRVYEAVRRAQQAAVRRARSGLVCSDLDATARKIIVRAGYGPRFTHGLGHGLGLEVHEGPSVNAKSRTVLKPGMVITIEPGVYITGWGGVRIEDDVVITKNGGRVLTHSERALIVL